MDPVSTKKYPLITIRGLPLQEKFLRQNVEEAFGFKPEDTDIFVVAYPKCGTTWTQYMVWEILHKGAAPPNADTMITREFPFLELTGTKILDDIPPPRTIKTHMPFHLHHYNPKSKYIYVVRNPWDCCVSYYHHLLMDTLSPQLTFDEHFELFIKGEISYGDFFDHVIPWFRRRNDPNMLFLTYEEMKKNEKEVLLKIAEFLGKSYYNELKDDQVLENCLKHTDFKYLKELEAFSLNKPAEDFSEYMKKLGEVDRSHINTQEFKKVNFFRKGEVGDWKNYFSQDQIKKFNEYMMRKIQNTELEKLWKPLPENVNL